jgi:hypothetical protein
MRNLLGRDLTFRRLGSKRGPSGAAPSFSPASLFASGEEGAWYEPSPTTAFLSTTNLTPCGVGDSCGFLLDKSQGAEYSGGSFTGLGSELVTNGAFDTDASGWTATNGSVSVSGGEATLTRSSSSAVYSTLHRSITTEVGKTYYCSIEWRGGTSPKFSIQAGTTARALDLGSSGIGDAPPAVGETVDFAFVATGTTTWITVVGDDTASTTTTASFDNISVRELPGRMQTQITAAARPTLQDSPDQIDFDGVDDFHRVVLPAMSNATVAYASPGVGAVILTGQTITAGNYDWDTDHAGLIILDRPLTASETTGLTAFLNARAGV